MTRLYVDSLRDILDAITKAQHFVAGMDFDAFQSNDEKSFAVTRALEIIGEATKQKLRKWPFQTAVLLFE